MDDYFFKNHVKACRNVSEDTSYLEIFNYSVCACSCLTTSAARHPDRLTTLGPIIQYRRAAPIDDG
jgi:hypothetical protein